LIEPSLQKSTLLLPNYTPTDGRSLEPSLFCATTSAICRQWMCSCISLKPRAHVKRCGELQWGRLESIVDPLPTIVQGLQGEILQDSLQQEQPYPLGWVSPLLDEETWAQETQMPRGLTPWKREVCDFLSSLQVVFSSVELIKHEYNPTSLKGYIGNPFPPTPTSVFLACVLLV